MAQQPDPEAIKEQMRILDEQMLTLRREVTERQFRLRELEQEKQQLIRQLPLDERFNQLFH